MLLENDHDWFLGCNVLLDLDSISDPSVQDFFPITSIVTGKKNLTGDRSCDNIKITNDNHSVFMSALPWEDISGNSLVYHDEYRLDTPQYGCLAVSCVISNLSSEKIIFKTGFREGYGFHIVFRPPGRNGFWIMMLSCTGADDDSCYWDLDWAYYIDLQDYQKNKKRRLISYAMFNSTGKIFPDRLLRKDCDLNLCANFVRNRITVIGNDEFYSSLLWFKEQKSFIYNFSEILKNQYPNLSPLDSSFPTTFRLSDQFFQLERQIKWKKDTADFFEDTSQKAIENAQYIGINSIAFVADLFKIKDSIFSVIDLLRGDASIKNISSLFLSLKYGLRLTIADLTEIVTTANSCISQAKTWNKRYQTARSIGSDVGELLLFSCLKIPVRRTIHSKIYYYELERSAMSLVKRLMDFDLWPTSNNMWDLVPFSFVIDWFFDIGSLLEDLDARIYSAYLDVINQLWSEKITIAPLPVRCLLDAPAGIFGTVCLTRFHRWTTDTLLVPHLRCNEVDGFDNWAELSAIIVQKHKS